MIHSLTPEELKTHTFIGDAEMPLEHTDRRDWLIAQGEAAGFVVTCAEAIPIFFSGATGRPHWSINFYQAGKLDRMERDNRKKDLGKIFNEFRAIYRGQ